MTNTINMALALVLGLIIGGMFLGRSKSATPAIGAEADVNGYVMEELPDGTNRAVKNTTDGIRAEEGTLLNGKKSGVWIDYYTKDGRVKSLTNFADGLKNGLHMTLTDRGQVTLESYYKNDRLHGKQTKYKFGSRVVEEAEYSEGVLDGVFKSYDNQGKIQREINYKNGLLEGKNIFYDTEGNVTMEYIYENNEKVSGGVVKE